MANKSLLQQLADADSALTIHLNRLVRWKAVRGFFAVISTLGDGKFWYGLLIMLPLLQGLDGLRASVHLGATGLVTLGLYKLIKGATQRPRPGAVYHSIEQGAIALDEYSFPSGHTMHAVVFTWIAWEWFPGLLPVLGVFTFLTSLSRVVLGLHYPTDVFLGACLGFTIALISTLIVLR